MCCTTPQYPLFTVAVVDDHNNVSPTAWAICEGEAAHDLVPFLQKLKHNMEQHSPGWRPSCFLSDDSDAQKNAIQEVFGSNMPVFLCAWHVKHTWLKQLLAKVKDAVERFEMMAELSAIMAKKRPTHLTVRVRMPLSQSSGSCDAHDLLHAYCGQGHELRMR